MPIARKAMSVYDRYTKIDNKTRPEVAATPEHVRLEKR